MPLLQSSTLIEFVGRIFAAAGAPQDIAHLVAASVSYTHLRAHETVLDIVCRLLLEKKNKDYYHLFDSTLSPTTTIHIHN